MRLLDADVTNLHGVGVTGPELDVIFAYNVLSSTDVDHREAQPMPAGLQPSVPSSDLKLSIEAFSYRMLPQDVVRISSS